MDEVTQGNNKEEQQRKLPLFSFAKISKFYLIPLIVPIFCILYNLIIDKFLESTEKLDVVKFYLTKIVFITRILGGSLYFVYNNKEENQTKSLKGKISLSLIFNDVERNKFIKALKIISIISIIELLFIEFIFLVDQLTFDFRPFYLLFVVPLSCKISGIVIFFHQKVYLAFSALGLIIVTTSTILYTDFIEQFNWYLMLMGIISSIFYALILVCHKYLMEELFVSPFLLLFITGLINFFSDFIFNICYNLITGENVGNIFTNITYLINGENMKECIIYLISMIIIEIIYFILVKLTLFYFSPTLLIITDLISPIITLILKRNELYIKHFLLSIIGYSISFISSIFYNELIICNFLGLNENTAENIRKRGQSESDNSLLDQRNSLNTSYCTEDEEDKEEYDKNEIC